MDHDAVIPAKKIAELNLQATLYKEDQVESSDVELHYGRVDTVLDEI